MSVAGDGHRAVGREVVVPLGWWSAWDRAVGPLLGGLVVFNVMESIAEADRTLGWAWADVAFSIVAFMLTLAWYFQGRQKDRVAASSWVLMQTTFRAARDGATIVIGQGRSSDVVDVEVRYPT